MRDRDPGNIEVAALVQDLEETLLQDGVDLFAPAHSLLDLAPDVALRQAYAARAAAEPTVVTEILRARGDDLRAAAAQLERAIDLDPNCAWAHYGLSHVLSVTGPGSTDGAAREVAGPRPRTRSRHVRARRLEAWMAARRGAVPTPRRSSCAGSRRWKAIHGSATRSASRRASISRCCSSSGGRIAAPFGF